MLKYFFSLVIFIFILCKAISLNPALFLCNYHIQTRKQLLDILCDPKELSGPWLRTILYVGNYTLIWSISYNGLWTYVYYVVPLKKYTSVFSNPYTRIWHKVSLLSGVHQDLIRSFHFLRPVVIPSWKRSVCYIFYLLMKGWFFGRITFPRVLALC